MKFFYPAHDGTTKLGTKNAESSRSGRLLFRIAEEDGWFDRADLKPAGV